jgi:hypothetical protein
MKLINYSFLISFFLWFSVTAGAQTKIPKTLKKTFYYSFENVSAESQLDKLKADVALLKGVTEVKLYYKSESAKGQIIVIVIEKEVMHEGDQEFDIRNLKELIIKNQLSPLELTQEETIIAN